MTLICLGIPKFTMPSVGPPSGASDPAMVNALASCYMSHRNLFEEDAGNNTDPQMLYGSSCCCFGRRPKGITAMTRGCNKSWKVPKGVA